MPAASQATGSQNPTQQNSLMMEEPGDSKPAQNSGGFKIACGIFTKQVLFRFLGLAIYLMDISSDVTVAIGDYKEGYEEFAYLTLAFVFLPGLLFATYMFINAIRDYMGELSCIKAPLWLLSTPLLPLWPVVRDIWQMLLGLVATFSTKRRAKTLERLQRPSRAYLLKFVEAFAEAAPQLVIRMLKVSLRSQKPFSDLRTAEIVQMSVSLLVLAKTVVSTHKKNVSTEQIIQGELDKDPSAGMPIVITILALIWWLFFLFARLEALTLFSVSFKYWIFLMIGIHIGMLFLFQTIASRRNQFRRIGVYFVGAFLFIFVYIQFNLTARLDVAPWFPYLIFTVVVFIENSVMVGLWFYKEKELLSNSTISDTFYTTNSYILNSTTSTSLFDPHANTTTPYSGNFNDTTSTPQNDVTYSPEELETYWEKLIFIHFISFAIAFLFMILTLCCGPCFQEVKESEETTNEQYREATSSEIRRLNP